MYATAFHPKSRVLIWAKQGMGNSHALQKKLAPLGYTDFRTWEVKPEMSVAIGPEGRSIRSFGSHYTDLRTISEVSRLRLDLLLIPYAEMLGFSHRFKRDSWQNSASFEKGMTHVWESTYHGGVRWRAADIISGHFQNHRTYASLKEALEREA